MAMANIVVSAGEYEVSVSFKVFDAYVNTPLGCHAGILGTFSTNYKKDGLALIGLNPRSIITELKKHNFYRKFMDEFLIGRVEAWQAWKGSYRNKGHWIISAPWRPEQTSASADYGTAEYMDLILRFCTRYPDKYGHAVITPPTDCGVHSNNSGIPSTRTMVWMPPHAKINPKPVYTRLRRTPDLAAKEVKQPDVPAPPPPSADNDMMFKADKVLFDGRQKIKLDNMARMYAGNDNWMKLNDDLKVMATGKRG